MAGCSHCTLTWQPWHLRLLCPHVCSSSSIISASMTLFSCWIVSLDLGKSTADKNEHPFSMRVQKKTKGLVEDFHMCIVYWCVGSVQCHSVKWGVVNGSGVVKHGKLKEADVLLIGCSESDGLVKVNGSRVELGGNGGEKHWHVRLVGNIVGVSTWQGERDCLDGLSKGNDPVPMVGDGFGLLGDLDGELEEISKVLGLLSLNITGVVRSKDFGKVDRISLDNVEPLVRGEVWTSWTEENLSNNKGRVQCPVIKELEALLDFWLKFGSKDCWGTLPGEELIDGGPMLLLWPLFCILGLWVLWVMSSGIFGVEWDRNKLDLRFWLC